MKPKTHPTVDNKEVRKQFELLKLNKKQEKELTLFLNGRAKAWEEKIEKAKNEGVEAGQKLQQFVIKQEFIEVLKDYYLDDTKPRNLNDWESDIENCLHFILEIDWEELKTKGDGKL